MIKEFNKIKLFNLVNKKNKSFFIISIMTFSIAVMIVSVLFFIRANNADFYRSNSLALNAGDISIYIENNSGSPISVSNEQQKFLQTLKKEGHGISTDYYKSFETDINGKTHNFVFRFQDYAYLDKSCIISTRASEKLKAMLGDTIHIDFLNTDFNVVEVENPTMNNPESNFYGYIILSSKYMKNFAELLELKDVNTNKISSYFNMRIGIKDSSNNFTNLYERVITNFRPVEKNEGSSTTVKIVTIDEIEADYYMIFEAVENVLLILTILSFIISAIGFLSMLYLKVLRQQKLHAILRVYGMSRKDSLIFASYDTLTIAILSNVLGILAGYLLFSQVSIKLTGIAPQYHLFNKNFFTVALKTFILTITVMSLCNLWMYSLVHNRDIMDIFQKRVQKKNKQKNLKWFFCGIILYSLIVAALLQKLIAVLYIFLVFLFVILLYELFLLCIYILKKFSVKITAVSSLSYKLMINRKNFSSLIGTSIVTGLLLVFVIYNINYGFKDYLEKTWTDKQGFNVCVTMYYSLEKDFEAKLKEHSFKYFRIYTKLVNYKNDKSPYYLGILRDENHIAKKLTVKQGEFHADPLFMNRAKVLLNESYSFNSDLELKLTQKTSKNGLSPLSYTVLVNYNDIKTQISNNYQVNFLLLLENEDLIQLEEIVKPLKVTMTTASTIVNLLRDGFSNYIVLIYITCLLLSIVIIIFMFALTYSLVLLRKKEFSIYRVLGASQNNIRNIIIIENICIAVISSLQTIVWTLSIFNLFSYIFTGSVKYIIPIWVIILIVFGISLVFWLISLIVIKTFQFGRAVDVLRSD